MAASLIWLPCIEIKYGMKVELVTFWRSAELTMLRRPLINLGKTLWDLSSLPGRFACFCFLLPLSCKEVYAQGMRPSFEV